MIYGYLRVSTDKQDSENQKLGIIEKAKSLGLSVEKWIIDDGVSGVKEPNKRNFGLLLNKIKKGDTIITSELSRLGRKLFMIMRILEYCLNQECKVYTVKDGYELGDNIQSKTLAFAFGLAAEIERDMISLRTKEALRRKKEEGVILGRPKGRKSSYVKLTGKDDIIIKLLLNGYAKTRIAKKLKVNRETLSTYIINNKLNLNKV
ncbi:MAG: recombinase family protein [Deltaproteobacteria bacterium]|jgi:DNA invertase Pin-like site-specific DNA recombinase|nr:recombinase family protein [Deltaproteobacteria bacterium]